MSYAAGPGGRIIHAVTTYEDGIAILPSGFSGFSVSFGLTTANVAFYVPVVVRSPGVVKKMFIRTGSSGTGNYDIGLYSASGVRLLSRGSTAHPASNFDQVWDCTDTPIVAGIYYLAAVSSNTADRFGQLSLAAPLSGITGLLNEASALPLPATATWAVDAAQLSIPIMGLYLESRES